MQKLVTGDQNIYDYFPDCRNGLFSIGYLLRESRFEPTSHLILNAGSVFPGVYRNNIQSSFSCFELDDLLNNAPNRIPAILERIKPIKPFEEYLQFRYYPFFREGEAEFQNRLKQTVNHLLDSDLPSVENIDINAVHYLRKLISILAEIIPYKPNIVKLSQKVGVSCETLERYLYLLEKADLLILLQISTHGISKTNKLEKIYLNNSNLVNSLADTRSNQGTLRETFFLNQLKVLHSINWSDKNDFLVDDKYTFKIGGKNKNRKQITGIENAFVAVDNIEYAQQNKIP